MLPDPDVNDVLARRLADFREEVTALAETIFAESGEAGGLNGRHVDAAYKQLMTRDRRARSAAQKNVTLAFDENRFAQLASYGMALALFSFGLFLLGYSAFSTADITGRIAGLVGGSFAQVLLLFPLRFADRIRKNNVAIRMLGYLLDNVDDPKLLADLVRRLMNEVTSDSSGTRDVP